ncbi:PilZ domain-containing protein [Ornithinibacillus caprae]|nr:PilZ domain-containing protein [Ornithinibacillus caprae]
MRYKRDEAFRFEFGEPLSIVFTIEQLNGKSVTSSDGEAKMLDISLNGMKILTSLNIPVYGNDVWVSISFSLNNSTYKIRGTLVWVEKNFDEYVYGVHCENDPELQDDLLNDLKVLGKKMANRK